MLKFKKKDCNEKWGHLVLDLHKKDGSFDRHMIHVLYWQTWDTPSFPRLKCYTKIKAGKSSSCFVNPNISFNTIFVIKKLKKAPRFGGFRRNFKHKSIRPPRVSF